MAKKTPEDWLVDIDNALLYREMFAREAAWRKIELNYLNDPHGDTAIGPNLVYSMGDSIMSALTVPDPEFVVKPERRLGIDKAPIIESLDNYFIRKLRIKRYVDKALLNGYLYGAIILKIGYDSEFGWSPYYDIGKGNNLLGMTFTQFNKQGKRIESPDIQPGWPWIRPVLPHDFVVPWGTIFLEDAPWVAHRVVRHIDAVKADPKYKNTSSLQADITMEDFMESYLSTGTKKQQIRLKGIAEHNKNPQFIELWEIRDRLTGEILVVKRNYDRYLRRNADAIQVACGLPYVAATLTQHPRSFWTTPPAYYLGQLQKTQFDISKQAEKQRRISVLKFLYRKNALSKEALSRFLSSDVGAAEGVDTQFPLNEILAPMQTGTMLDHIAYAENNRRDAREAIGFSRNQLGEYDASGRRTAREATIVAAGAQRRLNRREQAIADLYIDIISKVNKIIFEYWRVPREIMHDEGWAVVTGDMLKGDYQYDISLSTKRQLSRAERKVEALMMLGQMAPFLAGADIRALFTYLSDAVSDPAFERILAPMTGKTAAAPGSLPTVPATRTEQVGQKSQTG